MTPPKLTYFNLRARAEPTRFVLSFANNEFIDDRVNREQDWPKMKLGTPFGKLPIVEIDGKVVNQSAAICRYFAKKAGLAGADDWEDLLIDATVNTFVDMTLDIQSYHYDRNEESKKKKYELLEETIPFTMQRLDKQVKENNGHFVNGKLTWADMWVVSLLDGLSYVVKIDLMEKCPHIRALRETVLGLPAIEAWVAKRPKTHY